MDLLHVFCFVTCFLYLLRDEEIPSPLVGCGGSTLLPTGTRLVTTPVPVSTMRWIAPAVSKQRDRAVMSSAPALSMGGYSVAV